MDGSWKPSRHEGESKEDESKAYQSDDNPLRQRVAHSFNTSRPRSPHSNPRLFPTRSHSPKLSRRRALATAIVTCGLVLALYGIMTHLPTTQDSNSSFYPQKWVPSPSLPLPASHSGQTTVCLVGNAETNARALGVFNQWGGQFPTVFYIWGDTPDRSIFSPPRKLQYLRTPGVDLTFAEGMFEAVKAVRSQYACDYIFTHDDDLVFYLDAEPDNTDPTKLVSKLVSLLDTYHPAMAGFPWDVGDSRFPGMIELQAAFAGKEVAPLTGFDNGMVIYHHTVVDFFFPFAPRGEGGFIGGWTLGAHFLQMFGPLVFREHAVRLNAIRYNNTVNLDNQPIVKGSITIVNGLATVPWSRHPYEYPMNDAYISFLMSGLKNRNQPWGRLLTSADVVMPAPGLPAGYCDEWIIDRLDQFYEIRHEALSNNAVILRANLAPLTTPPVFRIRVIFFTKNRVGSFQRAWRSYWNARPIASPVVVDVFVDYDNTLDQSNTDRYEKFLKEIAANTTTKMPIRVTKSLETKGLRTTVMESWKPTSNHEFAIFVEDDIELSPYFLEYAEAMIKAYVYRDHADHRLHGISLYNLRYNEAVESFVSVENGNQPYIYQQAQSWGAVFLPEPWRQFQIYHQTIVNSGIDPVVPNSMTNRWPFRHSWKKPFMRFLVQRGGYFLYPNLPDSLSFSTNHVEPGTNDKPVSDWAKGVIRKKFTVPLLQSLHDIPLTVWAVPTPPLSTLAVYDMIQKEHSSLDILPRGESHVTQFDKCTIIITVYSRITTYIERINYYAGFPQIGQILLLWNNIDVVPPQLIYANYTIPVEILRMKKNSLNNRFFPWPQIKYSCIMNMDDDWDMPYEHMDYAITTWKGNFFNHLVGYSHQGRNHVVREIDGVPTTLYSPTFLSPQLLSGKTSFYSIVLTSGFIYHRKYLDYYTYQLPQAARDLVDAHMNCEDILFNYMVANETKSGPVVIDVWARMLIELGDGGLWSKAGHTEHRSNCLTAFNEMFGHNPLRYTTTMFKPQKVTAVPGLQHHMSQEKIPFDYPCNLTRHDAEGGCAMQMEKELWGSSGGWV